MDKNSALTVNGANVAEVDILAANGKSLDAKQSVDWADVLTLPLRCCAYCG